MTHVERFNEVLRITGTNVKSLSERLGYARPQGLYDVATGRTKSLSADLCRKIVTAFPEFNYLWLLTGEGEMLRKNITEYKESAPEVFPSLDAMKLYLQMMETIRIQAETIKKLTEGDESQKRAII